MFVQSCLVQTQAHPAASTHSWSVRMLQNELTKEALCVLVAAGREVDLAALQAVGDGPVHSGPIIDLLGCSAWPCRLVSNGQGALCSLAWNLGSRLQAIPVAGWWQ